MQASVAFFLGHEQSDETLLELSWLVEDANHQWGFDQTTSSALKIIRQGLDENVFVKKSRLLTNAALGNGESRLRYQKALSGPAARMDVQTHWAMLEISNSAKLWTTPTPGFRLITDCNSIFK